MQRAQQEEQIVDVSDLTRLSVRHVVVHGDLLILAVTGDDKFVLFSSC